MCKYLFSDYCIWLLGRVGFARYECVKYSCLLSFLFSTEFTYVLIMDANQAEAGRDLRKIYAFEEGMYEEDLMQGPCSVLEMLVSLSESFSENSGLGIRDCFIELLNNLGLLDSTDDNYDEYYISEVISRLLNRDYAENGIGSLFPIPNYEGDLRNMLIWNQMNCYILEKYPIR